MNLTSFILAQDAGSPMAPGGPATPPAFNFLPMAMIMGVFVFMILMMRSQRKREQRDREKLFQSLSKNQRVLTLGGVIGTIVQVKDNEVVLKVDEATNTRMTFVKTAVQSVLSDDGVPAGAVPK